MVDFGWLDRGVELPNLGKQVFRPGSHSSKEVQHLPHVMEGMCPHLHLEL